MKSNAFIKYSSMAIQMAVTILACIFLGKFLDERNATGKLWTVVFSIAGVGLAMYSVIKDLMKR
ncbi:MAG: AtpZ/AtpI family protein [Flavobacteriales bacterium]